MNASLRPRRGDVALVCCEERHVTPFEGGPEAEELRPVAAGGSDGEEAGARNPQRS
jgi:hypothetical protein